MCQYYTEHYLGLSLLNVLTNNIKEYKIWKRIQMLSFVEFYIIIFLFVFAPQY